MLDLIFLRFTDHIFALAEQELATTARAKNSPGLCKVATLAEIEAQGWIFKFGRYVGVTAHPASRVSTRAHA